ncbi:MAG: hypothetical protein KF799_05625 [Bdellovibrionales bacterium]|nr:hypothetical protein [Bdellovibrionales bacterium]
MKLLIRVAAVFAVGAFVHTTFADQVNETLMKVEDLGSNQISSDGDVDQLITNKKMRAESGSKSRWSINSDWSYNAGSVEKPFADDRPNIALASGTTDVVSLVGTINTKYNLNAQHSLAAGVGLRWIAPLAQNSPKNYSGDRADADNPYLTYQYLYKWFGIQSAFQVTPTLETKSNLKQLGYVGNFSLVQNNVYDVGTRGLSLGLYTSLMLGFYDKSGALGTPGTDGYIADLRAEQSDYAISICPFLEYQLTDKVNLRTVSNVWNYEHMRNESRFSTLRWTKVFQSVGVGISLTRDIFIYPNVQFLPDNMRADLTNVAINSNINIF